MSNQSAEAALKHRIPVIDRMMDVLAALEQRDSGMTIRDLVTRLHLPRTTIYRILNTLQMHDIVLRDQEGAYQLGPRLLKLATHVANSAAEIDIAAIAQPTLDKLAADVGDSVKLSVLDEQGVLVLAVARGKRENALNVSAGQRHEAHAGAAGKLLLSYLPEPDLAGWLTRRLPLLTSRTVTDPRRLKTELLRARRLGWAQDKGETTQSVHAFAAPVIDSRDHMVAAISIPFLAGTEPTRVEEIRMSTIAAARAISHELPRSPVR